MLIRSNRRGLVQSHVRAGEDVYKNAAARAAPHRPTAALMGPAPSLGVRLFTTCTAGTSTTTAGVSSPFGVAARCTMLAFCAAPVHIAGLSGLQQPPICAFRPPPHTHRMSCGCVACTTKSRE